MRVVTLAKYRTSSARTAKAQPRSPPAILDPERRLDPWAAIAWLLIIPIACAAGWYGTFHLLGLLWKLL